MTRTAPPPNPREPMGARGCGACALPGARALTPPAGPRKPGTPRLVASRVCSRPWPPGGLPRACPLACNKVSRRFKEVENGGRALGAHSRVVWGRSPHL